MSDMALGNAIGLAVGLAAGNASGMKKANNSIRGKIIDYSKTHEIVIINSDGVEIPVEQFAAEICGDGNDWPRWRIWAVVIGLGVFLAAAVIYYFTIRSN